MKDLAEELFESRPKIFKFLVDNGVSARTADEAQDMISNWAVEYSSFLKREFYLKQNLHEAIAKLAEKCDATREAANDLLEVLDGPD